MLWTPRNWLTLAAVLGFVSVAAGAFGAHGVADPQAKAWLQTGAQYGLVHVLATFACAAVMPLGASRARYASGLFLPGAVIFSGSLYAMALGGPRWFGAITPIGGGLLLAGWLVLAWSLRRLGHD
ncbi:MAG TPA: DUF423 domain-containing protein [Phenylobacterium sp.]